MKTVWKIQSDFITKIVKMTKFQTGKINEAFEGDKIPNRPPQILNVSNLPYAPSHTVDVESPQTPATPIAQKEFLIRSKTTELAKKKSSKYLFIGLVITSIIMIGGIVGYDKFVKKQECAPISEIPKEFVILKKLNNLSEHQNFNQLARHCEKQKFNRNKFGFPWTGVLFGTQLSCGVTLITPRAAITAAHCVFDQNM